MPSMTLLEAVQDVMSDCSMDEVNSISDTVEATQVANIVKNVWQEIQDRRDLPKRASIFQLSATGASTPTVLTMPDDVSFLESFEYDVRESLTDDVEYRIIGYVEPLEFFRRSNGLSEAESDVDLVTHSSGVTYKVYNDKQPSYYTVYNNKYILCDSYFSTLDTNLQSSKTRCLGLVEAQFTVDDTYVIDLDNSLMLYLLEKSKARVFSRLKKQRDLDAESTAKRLEIRARKTSDKLRGGVSYANFGRK